MMTSKVYEDLGKRKMNEWFTFYVIQPTDTTFFVGTQIIGNTFQHEYVIIFAIGKLYRVQW